jgi:rhamnose transport system ATP-binding protein
VNTLSGGNQQKTLFGKCLLREPKVLLLDEPTRGVDVGAKLRIYEFIHALAQRGIAILLVSSELEEIMGLAHRILVMRLGRLVAEFENRDLSMDQVMRAAFGFAAEDLTEGTVGS